MFSRTQYFLQQKTQRSISFKFKRCHILQTIHGALHQEAARLHILLANSLQLLNPLSQLHILLLQRLKQISQHRRRLSLPHNRLFRHRRRLKQRLKFLEVLFKGAKFLTLTQAFSPPVFATQAGAPVFNNQEISQEIHRLP
ncbi:unnamed protein product [Oikopleura dioica]|uniref:Uncharacterized protein n=1 Tax=Oikopleura dioica TaxID=34765 RepID=E4Y157_OIKDI|nr:unnamed protein product [Oikopleura dioica]